MPFSRSRSIESITRSSTSWFSERPGLPEQGVHERRLAVVDVGDDGDVAQIGGGSGGVRGVGGEGAEKEKAFGVPQFAISDESDSEVFHVSSKLLRGRDFESEGRLEAQV